MTKQNELYLLMHNGIPIKIDSLERVRAICDFGDKKFNYRKLNHGEVHLLRPDILEYISGIGHSD
jgi:hypothetical protein